MLALINTTQRDDMYFTLPDIPGVKWKPVLNSINNDEIGAPALSKQKIKVGWKSMILFEAVITKEIVRTDSPAR